MIENILLDAIKNYNRYKNKLDLLTELNIVQKMLLKDFENEMIEMQAQIKSNAIKQSQKSNPILTSQINLPIEKNINIKNTPPASPIHSETIYNPKTNDTTDTENSIQKQKYFDASTAIHKINKKTAIENKDLSINDIMNTHHTDLNKQIENNPIADLLKGMDLNIRYAFIHELFNHQEKEFLVAIENINRLNSFKEAEAWFNENVLKKNRLSDNSTSQEFLIFIKRRFS